MRLTRWTPMAPARERVHFHDEVNRLFEDLFTRSPLSADLAPLWVPPVDIQENENAFHILMDLPGVSIKDVKVNLVGQTLSIKGERRQEEKWEDKRRTTHRLERTHGSFERTFDLGASVASEGVKALYRDGVLDIQVPKAEGARVRQIEVQAN